MSFEEKYLKRPAAAAADLAPSTIPARIPAELAARVEPTAVTISVTVPSRVVAVSTATGLLWRGDGKRPLSGLPPIVQYPPPAINAASRATRPIWERRRMVEIHRG